MKVKWTYEGSSLEYIHWIFFTKNWGSWRFVLDSNGRSSTESIGWFGLLLSSLRKDCVSSYSEFQTLESTAKSGLVLPTWLIQLNWTIKNSQFERLKSLPSPLVRLILARDSLERLSTKKFLTLSKDADLKNGNTSKLEVPTSQLVILINFVLRSSGSIWCVGLSKFQSKFE